MGSGAKSYMRKDFLIYAEMRKYLVIYEEAVSHNRLCNPSLLELLIYERKTLFSFLSVYNAHALFLRALQMSIVHYSEVLHSNT
jgi:hypothetical protein